ncbi:hypothetical protein AB1Y20_002286 [Prymnesium parvum]|uniref:Hexosyltransferase n=1 Tax=Prymnesium parvum TaxID=97485 RepID=A0AB34J8P1_PRYPA
MRCAAAVYALATSALLLVESRRTTLAATDDETEPLPMPLQDSIDERPRKSSRIWWEPPRSSYAQLEAPCQTSQVKKLVIGIITAPNNFNRRAWIRQHLRVSEASCRNIEVLFVLGSRHRMTRAQQVAIRYEMKMHDDIVFVAARDWVPHAVAEKSLAWWQFAARMYESEWYCKTDDDSLMYLPRIERDLEMMAAMGRSHYYYGVMTWRTWIPKHTEPDAGCGDRGDDGPSLSGASPTLRKLLEERASPECSHALGPYPFADGSLQIISADLLHSFASTELTMNFSRSHLSRENPPFWTHEDAGIGYLMFHEAVMQKLPLTYVVLSAWRHNKFWINWFPRHRPSIPDGHVVNTHKVVTSMMAQIAMDAYHNTTYAADPIICGDCEAKWGWTGCHDSAYGRVPIERFACCNKALGH